MQPCKAAKLVLKNNTSLPKRDSKQFTTAMLTQVVVLAS